MQHSMEKKTCAPVLNDHTTIDMDDIVKPNLNRSEVVKENPHEDTEKFENKKRHAQRSNRNAPVLSYEVVMWTTHVIVSILACLDRFYWNIWPRETYKIGKGNAGSDRIELLEGPWSVKFFDIIARVSGRFSIVTLNLLFLVRLKFIENWLVTSWVHRYVLDCSNIVKANLRLHIWNGVAFSVLLLLHVWSILLPCIFHRYGAQIVPGYFEYPLSERGPPGFKDADAKAKMMSLQVDDVFRMVEMTVTLGIMIPLSKYWFRKRYHIALHMHRVAAVIVFIDIVRRHSHPHSIIINSPIFFIWLMEKLVIAVSQTELTEFQRVRLGEDYMAIFWKSSAQISKSIGPNVFLKLKDSSLPEPAHAFTSFQNRNSLQIDGLTEHWTTGVVMRVYHNKRKLPLSKVDKSSHTGRMYHCKTESATIEVQGPYAGEMSELIKQAHASSPSGTFCFNNISLLVAKGPDQDTVWRTPRVSEAEGAVVLIGTGSGVNYLIDALQFQLSGTRQLVILWSTRDTLLYNWVSDLITQMVSPADTRLRIVLANTNKSRIVRGAWTSIISTAVPNVPSISNTVTYVTGRIDFQKEIPENSNVFFQGSSSVGKAVKAVCKRKDCWLHKGTGGKEVDGVARKPPSLFENPTAIENHKTERLEDYAYK